MTLDDFPAVKDCLLKFFSTINLGDFIEFNYLYSDYVGGVKLLFEYHPNKRLIFSWDKSSKCFVGKFDNGEKLKRLGWLTVSQDAVAALKQFGKEPDNSFGNKTIAKRMKKYIYL
jgi:hypothetical protein